MEHKKKGILAGSIIASAIMALSAPSAEASGLFRYNNLGSGEEVRTNLSENNRNGRNFELKCGGKKDSTQKAKDHKCGEGKCGKKDSAKKGKDHKCGEGKCGGDSTKTKK